MWYPLTIPINFRKKKKKQCPAGLHFPFRTNYTLPIFLLELVFKRGRKLRYYWQWPTWGSEHWSLCAVLCLVAESYPTPCDPMDCGPPGSSVHGDSPGKNTGVGCHVLLQGIFPAQGLNPGLLHCRWILYCLSHLGSPKQTKT